MVTTNLPIATIEQYKILKMLYEMIDVDSFDVDMIDRYTVKITDKDGAKMLFTYDQYTDKISSKEL